MVKLLQWFQLNYPHLKEQMQRCQHNFNNKDINPYHIEGDCWAHTMMVCKIAEMRGYSKSVKVSALLHDIGKPTARRVNPKNNHVQFFGHEKLSAKLSKPIIDKLVSEGLILKEEGKRALKLIELHGILYKKDIKSLYVEFSNKLEFLKELIELIYCDNMGRFSKDVDEFALNLDNILQELDRKIRLKEV